MSSTFLNQLQQLVVETFDRPVTVIAGPGTGKTKTLVAKIHYLLTQKKLSSDQIIALTFTRKAANEMYQRLRQLLPRQQLPLITTFHGLAILQLESSKKKVSIVDDDDRKELLRSIIVDDEFKQIQSLSLREVELQISKMKNKAITTSDPAFQKLLQKYQEELNKTDRLDYDDLLVLHLEKLNQSPSEQFQYVFVDEFQDTNQIQYQILQKIATPIGITVIGDPKQAIYGFRGASSGIFKQFLADFPNAKVIELVEHYRSTQLIVQLSHTLFPDSPILQTINHHAGEVKVLSTLDRSTEADWIMRDIMQKTGGSDLLEAGELAARSTHNLEYADIAILYRTHSARRNIEQRLRSAGLPVQVSGTESFWQHELVQFFIQILKTKIDPTDKNKQRAVHSIYWTKEIENFLESDWSALSFTKVMESVRNVVNQELSSDDQLAWQSLTAELYQFDQHGEALQAVIEHYEKLKAEDFHDPQAQKISLLTMHGAKGLEFEVVYICSCVDDLIPHRRFHKDEQAIEEEKRLFYVALTRAKKYLYLLVNEGSKKQHRPSRFVSSLEAAGIINEKDDRLEKIVKKREKIKLKKSQLSLF